jgi:hypothetical protein
MAIFLVFPAFYSVVCLGQLESVILFLVWTVYKGIKSKRFFGVGLASSFVLVKPQFVYMIPFFILCIERDGLKKYFKGFLAGLILLFGISVLVSGWERVVDYYSYISFTEDTLYGSHYFKMLSFAAFIQQVLGRKIDGNVLFFVNTFVYLMFFAWFVKVKEGLSVEGRLSVGILLTLVFSMHVLPHSVLMLVFVFLYIIGAYVQNTDWRLLSLIVLVYIGLVLMQFIDYPGAFFLVLVYCCWVIYRKVPTILFEKKSRIYG